jgi:flagellar assembly protein FliH
VKIEIVKRPARPSHPVAVGALVAARLASAREAEATTLAAAESRAAEIVASARREAAAIRESAEREGREAGEGYWLRAARELAASRLSAIESVERNCILLAVAIAREIVRREIRLDPDAVARIAADACAPLRRDAALVVRVAPDDLERAGLLRERLDGWREVSIESDDALSPGECVAECGGVRVDATLGAQFAAIERRLTAVEEVRA